RRERYYQDERSADVARNRRAEGRDDLCPTERPESGSGKKIKGEVRSFVILGSRGISGSHNAPRNLTSRDVSTSLDMTVLALETSCDETAVAILRGRDGRSGPKLLASEVASQVAAHEKYGGIVPEIASRNHLLFAPQLLDRTVS